ncbi:MAG TPA: LysR substrate-binding domain-containing protein [Solirubrobacteraceae bacterium]|nr:LysR substrate-binding domain-containing protein [Solirubrobacteraceae bacterium]
MLNLARVRVFFEVARSRSFAGAADSLSYTPSAVSHQISALERELGTPLINRAARPWTLTSAGEQLYRRAEAALAELATAEDELAQLSAGEAGTVRLSSVISGLRSVVPPAAAALKARHPTVSLALSEAQPARVLRELRNGKVDVGIIIAGSGKPVPRSRTLRTVALLEQQMMVAVPTSGRLGRSNRLTLSELRGQSWLLPSGRRVPEFREEIDHLFKDAGYTPQVALELDDDVAGQALVAAGVGIGLGPGLAAPPPHSGVKLIPLSPPSRRTLYAVAASGPLRAPVETLLEELQLAAKRV